MRKGRQETITAFLTPSTQNSSNLKPDNAGNKFEKATTENTTAENSTDSRKLTQGKLSWKNSTRIVQQDDNNIDIHVNTAAPSIGSTGVTDSATTISPKPPKGRLHRAYGDFYRLKQAGAESEGQEVQVQCKMVQGNETKPVTTELCETLCEMNVNYETELSMKPEQAGAECAVGLSENVCNFEGNRCLTHQIELRSRKVRKKYWGLDKQGLRRWKYRLENVYTCPGISGISKTEIVIKTSGGNSKTFEYIDSQRTGQNGNTSAGNQISERAITEEDAELEKVRGGQLSD